MPNAKFNKDKIEVKFSPDEQTKTTNPQCSEHHESGISSLFGRVGENVTLHERGIHGTKPWSSIFPNAYIEMIRTFKKIFRIFF